APTPSPCPGSGTLPRGHDPLTSSSSSLDLARSIKSTHGSGLTIPRLRRQVTRTAVGIDLDGGGYRESLLHQPRASQRRAGLDGSPPRRCGRCRLCRSSELVAGLAGVG
uniref:Uncharacterized protein n=1 Tax=Triticum urartu TaxID=4572 RepID=A0A8R7V394_TRIUA